MPYNIAVDVRAMLHPCARNSEAKEQRLPSRPANGPTSLSVLCFTSAQKNLSARAEREHFAVCAIRLARETAATPMPNEPVTPQCPIPLRHNFHQVALDFLCIPVFR